MWLLIAFVVFLVSLLIAIAWRQVRITESYVAVQTQGQQGIPGMTGPPGATGKSGILVGGADDSTFFLQDVSSGRIVRYMQTGDVVTLNQDTRVQGNQLPAVKWAFVRGGVYREDQGAIGLRDIDTGRCMRHAGFTCHESDFSANNYDFAWLFQRTSPVQNDIYTIFNYYGDGMHLNVNEDSSVRIWGDSPPRQWRVIGGATMLNHIWNQSVPQ